MCFIFMTYSYVTNNLSSEGASTIALQVQHFLKTEYRAKHKKPKGLSFGFYVKFHFDLYISK